MPASSAYNIAEASHRLSAMHEPHTEPPNQPIISRFLPRQPLIPIAICLMLGILIDHLLAWRWEAWCVTAVVLLGCWGRQWYRQQAKSSAVLLLLLCVTLGGVRHHIFWSLAADSDVNRYFTQDSQLVRVRGKMLSEPTIQKEQDQPFRSAWQRHDRSRCLIDCEQIAANEHWQVVTGVVSLSVDGHLLHARKHRVALR